MQSTILLDLVRKIDSNIPGVMSGKEDTRNIQFSRTLDNIIYLKPKKQQKLVFLEDGYPIISKDIARYIHDIRHPTKNNAKTIQLRLTGVTSNGNKSTRCLSKKYFYLLDAPFEISDLCCYYLKEAPLNAYVKETQKARIDGTMASESSRRSAAYLKQGGCNNFTSKIPTSKPLSIWTHEDCWAYVRKYNLKYSRAYDEGELRTGCNFCMFGILNDPTRFLRLKKWNSHLYEYGMDELGLDRVLTYIDIPH